MRQALIIVKFQIEYNRFLNALEGPRRGIVQALFCRRRQKPLVLAGTRPSDGFSCYSAPSPPGGAFFAPCSGKRAKARTQQAGAIKKLAPVIIITSRT